MAIITVTSSADNGVGSLREAIATAQAGDTIRFAPNLANATIKLTSGQLAVNKNLIIDGANVSGLTISGNNSSRIFDVANDTSFTLRNLAIANGKTSAIGAEGSGGAIRTGGNTTLVIENSTFINNYANGEGGGAIFAGYDSTNTVINSEFQANIASGNGLYEKVERGGGAIAVDLGSSLVVKNSNFTENKGINGGAINTLLSSLTVENSTFTKNDTSGGGKYSFPPYYTKGYGGAIYTDGASKTPNNSTSGVIEIRDSYFADNKGAGQGGGLFLYIYSGDRAIVDNSTIINNQLLADAKGDSFGGGIRFGGFGKVELTNSTIANNTSLNQGGGLWVGETSQFEILNSTISGNKAISADGTNGLGGGIALINGSSPTKITNTTIANNQAGFQGGAFWGGGYNTILTNTIVANNVGLNGFDVKHQTGFQFSDGGGNIQSLTPNPNDLKITPNVTLADPLLGSLQEINGVLVHPLLPGSPAINTGNIGASPSKDQQGLPRDAAPDIGAVEFAATVVQLPEIDVFANNNSLPDNNGNLNFGSTTTGTNLTQTITIANTGNATLNLSNLSLPAGFTLVGNFPNSVAPTSSVEIQIQLNANQAGNFGGTLSFTNNDSNENPYNFTLSGQVNSPVITAPEIEVFAEANLLTDNVSNVNFGSTFVGENLTQTVTIANTGEASLNLSNLSLPDGFSLVGNFPETIASNSRESFQIQLDAVNVGNFEGTLSFDNNDSDENPYNFTLWGSVASVDSPEIPEISVLDSDVLLIGDSQQDVNLQFSFLDESTIFFNEIGVFFVDNQQGEIDGILPGEAGYLSAALTRGEVIFSAIPEAAIPDDVSSRQLSFVPNSQLGFYLVADSTTDTVLADLDAGKTPGNVFFNFAEANPNNFDHLQVDVSEAGSFVFSWEDWVGGGDRDFNDVVLKAEVATSEPLLGTNVQGQREAELLDLRDVTEEVTAKFSVLSEETGFDNSFGFYPVDDLTGSVDGLHPGDDGYAAAAISSRVDFADSLPEDALLAPYLVVNATPEEFLMKNPQNQPRQLPQAYFPYLDANPDGFDHVRLLGDNVFAFEDLFGGGDRDYTDLILQVDLA
ncbi:MAG: choice-of-anchor D domain-containing protein [Oscillatoria sp. PMC 1068.18]|nr:choice-of-anchor D domain-containing protein [Oscillatoria sp. PMC 1076.18]MEC4987476.1 choice-of-anchor D domain-containing protein [Oscillatoria sp. PMC 1068.18]